MHSQISIKSMIVLRCQILSYSTYSKQRRKTLSSQILFRGQERFITQQSNSKFQYNYLNAGNTLGKSWAKFKENAEQRYHIRNYSWHHEFKIDCVVGIPASFLSRFLPIHAPFALASSTELMVRLPFREGLQNLVKKMACLTYAIAEVQ